MRCLVAALVLANLSFGTGGDATPVRVAAQATGVLRVQLTLGPASTSVAIPRHVLLVSDNPASRAPWRLVVSSDGTGRVTLPPGNYTVESEAPLLFQGKAYEWRQTLDVPGSTDTTLELTIDNAEVTEPPPPPADDTGGKPLDPWDLLVRWQDSVVALWTPTALASGVVIGPEGLIATNHRVVGNADVVEVQVGPDVRVAARVIASDAAGGVAILRANPAALAPRKPVPISCGTSVAALTARQRVVAIATRPGGQPAPTPGTVRGRVQDGVLADFEFAVGSTGGPVFSTGDALVGLTAPPAAEEDDARIVGVEAVCAALASARPKVTAADAPSATPLPAEPGERASDQALEGLAKRRVGSLNPLVVTSADFEIALLTPVVAYQGLRGPMDFANWSLYVSGAPPVLLIRVTPKQAERFWTKVARGAAMTQGIALPAFKQYKPGFARMRVVCGGDTVAPIHPLVIERPVSPTAAVREGLYVLALDAIGPQCRDVTLEVYSEKTPDRRDAVTLDAAVLEQLARDAAEYRALMGPTAERTRGAR